MSKLSILTAYAVPLINVEFDDSDALNAELRKAFLEYAAQGDTWANKEPFVQRNASLFESAFNLFDWNHPAIARLRDQ